ERHRERVIIFDDDISALCATASGSPSAAHKHKTKHQLKKCTTHLSAVSIRIVGESVGSDDSALAVLVILAHLPATRASRSPFAVQDKQVKPVSKPNQHKRIKQQPHELTHPPRKSRASLSL